MTFTDILILAAVVALAAWSVYALSRGKGSSCSGCAGCPASSTCSEQKHTHKHPHRKHCG